MIIDLIEIIEDNINSIYNMTRGEWKDCKSRIVYLYEYKELR